MSFQPIEIPTERLLLRPWRMGDVDDAFIYASDEEWARFLWNVPQPYTRKDAEEFVARVCAIDWTAEAAFAIQHGERVIGGIRLYLTTPAKDVAGLGYNVGRGYWNQG